MDEDIKGKSGKRLIKLSNPKTFLSNYMEKGLVGKESLSSPKWILNNASCVTTHNIKENQNNVTANRFDKRGGEGAEAAASLVIMERIFQKDAIQCLMSQCFPVVLIYLV